MCARISLRAIMPVSSKSEIVMVQWRLSEVTSAFGNAVGSGLAKRCAQSVGPGHQTTIRRPCRDNMHCRCFRRLVKGQLELLIREVEWGASQGHRSLRPRHSASGNCDALAEQRKARALREAPGPWNKNHPKADANSWWPVAFVAERSKTELRSAALVCVPPGRCQ